MNIIAIELSAYERLISKMNNLNDKLNTLRAMVTDKGENRWLDSQEVCEILRIAPRTLQSYRDNGKIAFSQTGKKIYYTTKEINNFLKSSKR